jgi:hypothetical protein
MAATFIETLRRIVNDPSLPATNTLMDTSMVTYLTNRVNALTPDVVTWKSAPEVLTTGSGVIPTGSLAPNVLRNAIELDISGFEFASSRFRDGLSTSPRKIRRRIPGDLTFTTPDDRVRYIMADPTDGVFLLDSNLEIVRSFPGLVASGNVTGATYRLAQTACAATIPISAVDTELMFIACGLQHCVKIFNYETGAEVATIGVPGTAGLPDDDELTEPVSVTVDEEGTRLFIACRTGTAGSAAGGFVAEYDITDPTAPVFVENILVNNGLQRLNLMQCFQPSDVFYVPSTEELGAPPSRLWVANGLGDVAALAKPDATWTPQLVLAAQGRSYVLGPDVVVVPDDEYAENALDVYTDSAEISRLYVAASRTAQVEVFRVTPSAGVSVGSHEDTYCRRGIESTMPYGTPLRVYSTPLQPSLTFGVLSSATGVVADEGIAPGDTEATAMLVIADADAGRVQRLRTNVYAEDNTVTFTSGAHTVPVNVVGWFLPSDANFPVEFLTLEVRDPGDSTVTPAIAATAFREVPRLGMTPPIAGAAMVRTQFRLRARLPRTAPISAYSVPAVGVMLRQEW